MLLTLVSPDKLTLAMFIDFYKSIYDSNVKICDLNCLFSEEVLEAKMRDVKTEDLKSPNHKEQFVLIKFKTKPQTKQIPVSVEGISDFVIKFDLYSTEPILVKADYCEEKLTPIIDRWKKNIEFLNKMV